MTDHYASHKQHERCEELDLQVSDGSAVIVLRGEIDIEIQPCFMHILNDLRGFNGEITVDAREVEFIDSSGIAILGEIARRHPNRVTLINTPPTMLFILEVTDIISSVQVVYPEQIR